MKSISKTTFDISICVICLLISIFLGVWLCFGKHEDFSERENRALQEFPEINMSRILNGKFFAELSSFSSDQFPMRNLFSSTSTVSELILGRNESNGTVVTNKCLLARHDYEELDTLKNNLGAISAFAERESTPTFLLVAPRAIDVMKKELPILFFDNYGETEYKLLYDKINPKLLIDTTELLQSLYNENNSVWYRTDHHWTTFGAYNAYLMLGEELGIKTYSKEYFDITLVSTSFLGTSYSRAALPYPFLCDTIELYRYEGDEDFCVYHPATKKNTLGFYDTSALGTTDKYRIFLGGNSDLIKIRDAKKEKPKMLLIKDSFANSLIPFISLHYDVDVIDLRYYKTSVKNYISENSFDVILAVYGIDTLASDASCSNIVK